jgi:uncharacterized paraquat-inducible protein A
VRERQDSRLGVRALEDQQKRSAASTDGSRACTRCHGTGIAEDPRGGFSYTCPACLGKGRTTREDRRIYGVLIAILVAITLGLIALQLVQHAT